MHLRNYVIFGIIFLILLLTSGISSALSTIEPASSTYTAATPQLRLHRGVFDARTEAGPAPTAALAAAAPGPYAMIQLRGPVTMRDREALVATGVQLLEYLPDYAYLVQGTADQLAAAAALPQVYARAPFTLADKLAPALLRSAARGEKEPVAVRLIGWPDDNGLLRQELQRLNLSQELAAAPAQLPQLAALEAVRWIEPIARPRLLNDYARNIMNVDPVWQDWGFYGAGQIVAYTDSGLDTGDLSTLSPDFGGRVVATHVLSSTGHWDDNNGHGTHVAGSLAGAGVRSGADPAQHDYAASFAGVAPEANLVVIAFEADANGNVSGLDYDLYPMYSLAYGDGARIHSNSWGEETGPASNPEGMFGGYPYSAQRTDEFIWDHPDTAIFFAAGNSGQDCEMFNLFCLGNGIVDPDSLITPGTAKNVITVGAAESNRNTGGLAGNFWLLFGAGFWVDPIATDIVSNNANGMAAFSSRGPADDGRLKPDIVTPGTNILSNRSFGPGAGTSWGVHETNPNYVYSLGTSMATPLVAGMGVLAREWLDYRGDITPSAALLKGILLNTTHDIAPGQYGTGATQEVPFSRPNSVSGWGRADLGFVNAPLPYGIWYDDHAAGMVTGQAVSYTGSITRPLTVLTDTEPLRVMLTWTDPPASLSAAAQLVNDLDLVVTDPTGAIVYSNGLTTTDRINNVEGVTINNPHPGDYKVEIQAFNVPSATQPYALVVAGPLARAAVTPTLAIATGSGGAADLSWTTDAANCRYEIHSHTAPYFTITNATFMTPPGALPDPINSYSVSGALGDVGVNYYYRVRAWSCGVDMAISNEVGAFDFAVIPGS